MRNLKESQVIQIWQRLMNSRRFITEGGELLTIIYPGRINDDRGADFRDAVISTNSGIVKGDIEVHVKSSDWQAHQHHRDAAYNRVILHVVMWHDTETNHQYGRGVPILALNKYITNSASQYPVTFSMPCQRMIEHRNDSIMACFLDTAGEERFLAKAAKFSADLAKTKASQCLYQGIMMALGYSKNKASFLELASRLPLQILESIVQSNATDDECLAQQQALLLGTAGLLPSQCQTKHGKGGLDGKWVDKLEGLWASSSIEPMSYHNWHLFKVRPSNFPTRRIVAMSYLTARYRAKGMFDGIVNMIRGLPASQGRHRLEKGLMVTTDGYWASHFDFGSTSRLESPTLLGHNRTADIVVNVLLPFIFAWGKLTCQPELERNAIDLYHGYPRLVENTVEWHMRSQLQLSRILVNSAQRQQGLIHIYTTLCTQGKCGSCQLS